MLVSKSESISCELSLISYQCLWHQKAARTLSLPLISSNYYIKDLPW